MPTLGIPSASCHTAATMRSISLLSGGRIRFRVGLAAALEVMLGGGSLSRALRSIFPLSVSGNAGRKTKAEGTM